MFPILTELEILGTGVPIQTYGVAMFLALITGLLVGRWSARRSGHDPDHLLLGFILLMPAILLGAKLIPLAFRGELWQALGGIGQNIAGAENRTSATAAWITYLLMPGGSTLGAALGGGLGLLLYVRRFRLPLGGVLDTLAPALALGLPIMRLGCLAAGCCFGAPSGVPWAIVYTNALAGADNGVPLGIAVHPTPVYEAIGALLLGVYLLRSRARQARSGVVFAQFVAGYGLLRLALTPLRGDAPALPGALAWAAVAAGGVAAVLWLRDRATEATPTDPPT